MNRVHPPTYGSSPLGQGTKRPNPGYSPPSTVTAQLPPMPGAFLKRQPVRVHRAVDIFLSVMLFFGILYLYEIFLFISLCISLVPQH